jgi:AraC family transcriptional activator of pobA
MNTPFGQIPVFDLYGEASGLPDLLHVERIEERAAPLDWTIRVHRHPALVQVLWIGGRGGTAHIDGAARRFGPDTCIFVPRLCTHGFLFDEGCDGIVLTMPMATLDAALLDGQPARLASPWVLPSGPRFGQLMAMVADEHRGAAPYRRATLTGLVGLIAHWIARRAEGDGSASKPGPYDRLIARFLDILDARYRDEKEVAAYAGALSKTPSHLNRACGLVLGKTASAVIRERVMLEARRELAYSARAVSDIAYSLGYGDPAHFTRVFRTATGQTPRAFRKAVNG